MKIASVLLSITAPVIKQLAHACGFELAGVTLAEPSDDFERFQNWREAGMAGEMSYMTDRRGDLRSDPRLLLPSAKSILCVGKLYNTPYPYSTELTNPNHGADANWGADANRGADANWGWISRYAWGDDYHQVLRASLLELVSQLTELYKQPFDWKACVDTAPLLERSYARDAGLGWIGRNTCLINQQQGSWFFLAELLLSIPLEPDQPAPFRCGTCRRCIDACPTQALVPITDGSYALDSRLCISYLTIEKRGSISPALQPSLANQIFGCDICQDVCPWNRRAAVTSDAAFGPAQSGPHLFAPSLEAMAELTEQEFRSLFRRSPVWRTKYEGFLRNVAIALGNSGRQEMKQPLEKLAEHASEIVSSTARHALASLDRQLHK